MKTKLFLLLASVTLSLSLQAQQGFYIKAGLGYAIPQASQSLDVNGRPYSGSTSAAYVGAAALYDINKVSFTSGLQTMVGVGYMFNKNVGVELDGNFTVAGKTYTTTETSILDPSGSTQSDAKFTTQAKLPVYILPSLIVQSSGNKLIAYARAGLALPVNGGLTVTQEYTYDIPIHPVETLKEDVKTNFAIGFSGAAGARYNLGSGLSVWAEMSGLMSSLYAKEAKVVRHGRNDDPVPNPNPLSPLEGSTIKFSTNGKTSANQQPTYSIPFSNIGFNFGIALNLHKEKDDNKER